VHKKFSFKGLRVIFFLVTLSFIHDFYALYLFYYQHKSNFIFYNIYQLTETISLYCFFCLIIRNTSIKKVIVFFGILYCIVWLLSFLEFGTKSYYTSCTNFENMTLLALAIFYYYEQIIIIDSAFIYAESTFWIVTAYFIYMAGIFFLYLYMASLSLEEQEKYYVLNYIFIIIRTILLSVALLIKPGFSKIDNKNLI